MLAIFIRQRQNIKENRTQLAYTMLLSIRIIAQQSFEVITHNVTLPRITFRILLP